MNFVAVANFLLDFNLKSWFEVDNYNLSRINNTVTRLSAFLLVTGIVLVVFVVVIVSSVVVVFIVGVVIIVLKCGSLLP